MTRSYKTSYKTHRNSARFHVAFDAPTIAAQVQEVCTICGGKIEESPMMRGVCYDCYRNLRGVPMPSPKVDVEPWNEIPDAGTRFIISGGEVLELDSHLESAYDERNGDIETDMMF